MQYGFGIDLGGTTVKMALFDREGEPRYKWEIPTDTRDGGSRILNDIAESCLKWLDTYGIDKQDVLGIGIGGRFYHFAALAKKALAGPLGAPHPDPH